MVPPSGMGRCRGATRSRMTARFHATSSAAASTSSPSSMVRRRYTGALNRACRSDAMRVALSHAEVGTHVGDRAGQRGASGACDRPDGAESLDAAPIGHHRLVDRPLRLPRSPDRTDHVRKHVEALGYEVSAHFERELVGPLTDSGQQRFSAVEVVVQAFASIRRPGRRRPAATPPRDPSRRSHRTRLAGSSRERPASDGLATNRP